MKIRFMKQERALLRSTAISAGPVLCSEEEKSLLPELLGENYDIAIIGGGIVGLTTALALAALNTDFRMIVFEARDTFLPPPIDQYDYRVSAISLASQRIFENLGVWQAMCARRVSPYLSMHVWDAAGKGAIHFSHTELAVPALGYIVENSVMHAALLAAVTAHPQITFLQGIHCQQLTIGDEYISFCLAEKPYRASLLIAADGVDSWVRQAAGFSLPDRKTYGHTAIVATVKTSWLHGQCAQQRFLPTGPLAFLPLADASYSSIVWSVTHDEAARLMALSLSAFANELAVAFDRPIDSVQCVSERYTFIPEKLQMQEIVRAGVALVGDAAHAIHPLAGQGLNLGLLDAVTLAEVVATAASQQRAIASIATLRKYARRRKTQTLAVQTMMDFLKNLFASSSSWVQRIRNAGLISVDRCAPLKKWLAEMALGQAGDVPVLARQKIK